MSKICPFSFPIERRHKIFIYKYSVCFSWELSSTSRLPIKYSSKSYFQLTIYIFKDYFSKHTHNTKPPTLPATSSPPLNRHTLMTSIKVNPVHQTRVCYVDRILKKKCYLQRLCPISFSANELVLMKWND